MHRVNGFTGLSTGRGWVGCHDSSLSELRGALPALERTADALLSFLLKGLLALGECEQRVHPRLPLFRSNNAVHNCVKPSCKSIDTRFPPPPHFLSRNAAVFSLQLLLQASAPIRRLADRVAPSAGFLGARRSVFPSQRRFSAMLLSSLSMSRHQVRQQLLPLPCLLLLFVIAGSINALHCCDIQQYTSTYF